jgi:hypothetical protein
VHDLIRKFSTRAHAADGCNEVVIGEVIRAMARLGHPSILFRIRDDRQILSFRATHHPTITTFHVIFDHISGQTLLSEAMFGNQIRLHVVAEQRQRLSHPAELLRAAELQHAHAWEQDEVSISQEQSSTLATTTVDVQPDQLNQSNPSASKTLSTLLQAAIENLSSALAVNAHAVSPAHDPAAL